MGVPESLQRGPKRTKTAFLGHKRIWWLQFGALLGSYWGPQMALLTPEAVPMHHWRFTLTCSTYISHCSASPEMCLAPTSHRNVVDIGTKQRSCC